MMTTLWHGNRKVLFPGLILLILLALVACSASVNRTPKQVKGSPFSTLSTFRGRVPWVGCDGLDIVLNIRPDGLYQLRKSIIRGEDKETSAEMGRWKYDAAERLLVLGRSRGALRTLVLQDNNTLRLQDIEGVDMVSASEDSVLHLESRPDPFPDSVKMRGMYRSLGATGVFRECQSGVSFPVAARGEYRLLEHHYDSTPHGQGDPLLVTLSGSLLKKDGSSGGESGEELVVERFGSVVPGQDCTGEHSESGLFDRTWRLVELAGKPVRLDKGQREPFVTLETKDNKMHGFSGCNRFFGTYLAKGEIFVFNKMAMTRMACPQGMALEDGFLKALEKTEAYRVRDGVLELRDRDENILARLQSGTQKKGSASRLGK